MFESFRARFRALLDLLLARLRHVPLHAIAWAGWVFAFVVLMAMTISTNPAKLHVFTWFAGKSIGAALLGALLFLSLDTKPSAVREGIERAMAQTRLVTLVAALIVGAGLLA